MTSELELDTTLKAIKIRGAKPYFNQVIKVKAQRAVDTLDVDLSKLILPGRSFRPCTPIRVSFILNATTVKYFG